MSGPLDGLRVVELSTTLTSATIAGFLADFGADVVAVEPLDGSPLRSQPAFPFWGRGQRSIALDLHAPDDADVARALASRADVVIETFRPGVVERFGLGYDDLAPTNPGLVFASVTAFGRTGELAQAKGYEGLVMARLGGHDALGVIIDRPGPAFCSPPFASWSGAHTALHGILAALFERERSGLGQRVDTTLVQAFVAQDPWNAMIHHIARQYPEAFTQAGLADDGASVPNNSLFFRLLVALSADGRWLQFSQTTPRLFEAFMRVLGLDWMFSDPKWKTAPDFDDIEQRTEYYEMMLAAVRAKTAAEWQKVFDREPNVWAEIFRRGSELLDHPQMVHDRAVVSVDDTELGGVRQPGPLVQLHDTPGAITHSAPALDEHGEELRATAAGSDCTPADAAADAATDPPLRGVTVIELGSYFAAPYGATLLTDLGARVIKVEQLDGDPIRTVIPFPEVGAVKVLQGKECVAVDIHSDEGRTIVHELVRDADAILVSFRAGVVERLGLDPATLLAVNPDLVYLTAPGYGSGGPCGHRPAFAPTIGAGSGLAMRNLGESAPSGPDLDVEVVKPAALRVAQAAMSVANADGFSALGVATALLLGLVARDRGAAGQAMETSMLRTLSHVLVEDMVEYDDRPPRRVADPGLHGLGARYRLYETAEDWVFLAAPAASEWDALTAGLLPHVDLAADPRFADEEARVKHDDELAEVLAATFTAQTAAEWEEKLLARDVGCLRVRHGAADRQMFVEGSMGEAKGWVTEVPHPTFGTAPRLMPLVEFSRSTTVVGTSALCGTHTEAVLTELGYDPDRIDALRAAGVIL